MTYQFCYSESARTARQLSSSFDEREFEDRHAARHFVIDNLDELQRFAIAETGRVYGYAVELDERDKPTAILHRHKIADWIWIDLE